MNAQAPFQPSDLEELDALLARAEAVVPMVEIANGLHGPNVIGLRHDVDNTITEAVDLARWEAERGYRATYYMLHTAPYWHMDAVMQESVELIQDCGHEIGFHNDVISEALETHRDPLSILDHRLAELRSYANPVVGTVAHGNSLCHQYGYVNDEVFEESQRDWRQLRPQKNIGLLRILSVSRKHFGLEYDANWLTRGDYLSDSGGRWSQPFETVADGFPSGGQLHMLVHPCWWREALTGVAA